MDNMDLWNKVKAVPENAQKKIEAGRLKNMTDINPTWRLEKLTEIYGPCGNGWYFDIDKQWIEQGADGVVTAFCNISLYVNNNGEWSKPISGTGGSQLVQKESKGLHTNDECFKMALTDAIGGACKLLGIGADIYWNKNDSKYQSRVQPAPETIGEVPEPTGEFTMCSDCGKEIKASKVVKYSTEKFGSPLCFDCQKNH